MIFDLRRRISVLLVSVLVLLLLPGCYKTETIRQDTSINPENIVDSTDILKKPVMEKIRVWSDNAHEKDLRLQQIEQFNSTAGKQLGIEIEYTVYGSNYQEAIKAALQSGTAPELFRPTSALLKNFVDAGYMVPITELPGGDDLVEEYQESLMNNQHVFNGEVYTLPYNLTTYKLIINDDLFQKAGITKAPTTWKEVRETAQRITEIGEGKAFGWILGLQSDWMISTYLIRPNGTNVGHVGFNYRTMTFDFTAFRPVFEAVQGMIEDGSVFPGYEGLDADAVRAQFAEGRIGMIPGASFDINVYNDQFPASCNWSVVPVPAFTEEGSPYKEFADATSLLGVGIAAKQKAAKTLEVLKFFYSDENAAQMYENSLYIPFRQEALDLTDNEPGQKGFAEFANIPDRVLMRPSPENGVVVEGEEYRRTISNYFAGLYDGQEMIEVLEDLDNRYNNALKQLTPKMLTEYKLTDEVLNSYIGNQH